MARYVLSKLNLSITIFLILACLTGATSQALGQKNAPSSQVAAAKTPAYEVVSVRPSKLYGGMSIRVSMGRFSAKNITLWGLLYNSYDLRPNNPLPELPGWATSAQFDVEAKADGDTIMALQKLPQKKQQEQSRLMLQAILEDRFQLRTHYETKESPIYTLVIAKVGFKLKELPANEVGHGSSWGPGGINVQGGSIENLVHCLSDVLGRAVVDRTGLAGKYDIALKWTPDEQQGASDAGPSIFTAIQEQLGLNLKSTKGPVDTLIIDHIDKPSEN